MMKSTSYISAALVALALAGVAGCASTPTKEGTGEYMDDTVITTKVKSAMYSPVPSLVGVDAHPATPARASATRAAEM